MEKVIADMVAELKAAGYNEAQIAKEIRYVERVDRENMAARADRAWGFGFHHADHGHRA
jgi:hypothetical protein